MLCFLLGASYKKIMHVMDQLSFLYSWCNLIQYHQMRENSRHLDNIAIKNEKKSLLWGIFFKNEKIRKNTSTMGNISPIPHYGEYFSNSPLWGIFFQFPVAGNMFPIPHCGEYLSNSQQWGIFIPKTKKILQKWHITSISPI